MRILLCFIFSFWAIASSADTIAPPLPALYAVSGVASDDALNIREAPNASAPIINTLAFDAAGVEVLAFSREGGWGQINAGERTGWVAMRYLTPTPSETTVLGLPIGLSCFGTEPFWDIAFFDEPNLILNTPDTETGHAILGASPYPQYVDLARYGFFFRWQDAGSEVRAYILPGQCSDGMSDRAYGLHYIDDRGPRKGCCSLQ